MQDVVKDNVNLGYEYVCTCKEDVAALKKDLESAKEAGYSPNSTDKAKEKIFNSCSEAGMGIQKKKVE